MNKYVITCHEAFPHTFCGCWLLYQNKNMHTSNLMFEAKFKRNGGWGQDKAKNTQVLRDVIARGRGIVCRKLRDRGGRRWTHHCLGILQECQTYMYCRLHKFALRSWIWYKSYKRCLAYRSYVAPNKPAIFRGAASHWPAIEKWTDDYLR